MMRPADWPVIISIQVALINILNGSRWPPRETIVWRCIS